MNAGGFPGAGGGVPSMEEIQQQQAQQAANEERRQMILDQVLEPAAKERIARMAIVRKEKARLIEDSLIRGATNGQIKQKVTDEQLVKMLDGIGGEGDVVSGGGKKAVVVQRRKYGMDDDEDDDDTDLL